MDFPDSGEAGIRIVGADYGALDQRGTTSEPSLAERLKNHDPLKRLSTMSAASNTSSESFFKKSEFLDPLVRIN